MLLVEASRTPHLPSMGAEETSTERIIEGVLDGGVVRLDKALAEASGLSRERVKALLGEGRVLVEGDRKSTRLNSSHG